MNKQTKYATPTSSTHDQFQFGNFYLFLWFYEFVDGFFADGAVHNEFTNAAICCQFVELVRNSGQIIILIS